jgi:hypothetical protein
MTVVSRKGDATVIATRALRRTDSLRLASGDLSELLERRALDNKNSFDSVSQFELFFRLIW